MNIPTPPGGLVTSGFIRQIFQAFVQVVPAGPVRMALYTSTTLPDAAKYQGYMVWVDDIAQVAVSDGTDWLPLTQGSPL